MSMPDRILGRWTYLASLWREGLWGRWLALPYGAVTLFVLFRDDFWRPANSSQYALVNVLPHFSLAEWSSGAVLLVLFWLFEASFRLNAQLKAQVEAKPPQRTAEQEGKYRAARAILPATLDEVFNYAKASARWLRDVREKASFLEQGRYKTAVAVQTSPRPDHIIKQLHDAVEYVDPEIAEQITEILRQIQVQRARITGLEDYFEDHMRQGSSRAGLVREVDQFTADSVKIAALARQLIPYARQEDDGPIKPLDCWVLELTFRDCQLDVHRDVLAWNILSTPYLKPSPYTFPPVDELENLDE